MSVKTGWAWWDAQKPYVQTVICLAFLFVLPLFVSPDTILGDKKFLASDIVQWRGGAQSIIEAREKYGYEPLWAPNMYGGMPAYFISYLYDVSNIDTLIAYGLEAIFPANFFWVGLAGFFFLFRYVGAGHFASVFGALTLAFTTYIPIIIGAGHNSKFAAFNYISWVLLGFFMILNSDKRKLLALGIFALALSLELRAGHPQVTYYFVILMGIIWLFDVIKLVKEKSWNVLLEKNALFLGAAIIAVISVVQPYWSKTEFTPYSTRGGSVTNTSSGLDLDYAMAWSQGWGELLTLAIPNSYGGASGDGTYWGPKPFTSGPHYLGALAFLFFIFGIMYYKGRYKTPLLIGVVFSVLFSLGNNFLWFNELFFNYFPYFSKFRTPEMWLLASVFGMTFIAVFGLDYLLNKPITDKKWIYATAGSLALGLFLALAGSGLLSFEKDSERRQIAEQIARSNNVSVNDPRVQQSAAQYVNNRLKPERKKAAQTDAWRFVILITLGGALTYAVSEKKIKPAFAALGILALAAYDMISVGKRYIPEHSKVPANFSQEAKVKQQLTSLDEFIRDNILDETETWPYRAYPIASNPFNNAAPSFYYPSIGGYTAVKIGAFQDFINEALNDADGLPRTTMLAMLNVKFMSIPQQVQLPGFHLVHKDKNGVVLALNDVLPKAWFVLETQAVQTAKDALEAIKSDSFNPATTAIVEGLKKNYATHPESQQEVHVTRYEPRFIEIHTKHEEDAFLVLSEVFYPKGWKAELDGIEIPIYKTNFILRGFEIPSGEHTLKLSFNPASHELGKTISWAGTIGIWLIFVIGLLLSYRKPE